MRRFLSTLVLFTFALTVQMSFVHALDMEMGRSMATMSASHQTEHNGALCSENTSTKTSSCFTEIGESKWIEVVRKIELTPFFFILLFAFSISSLFQGIASIARWVFSRRIFHNPTLYLGLYGIIRNVN